MPDKLTEGQNVTIGVVAAVLEGVILQPTLYWKNARAQKAPFTMNPRVIYRGTLASCLNECQMLGLQFGCTGFFQRVIDKHGGKANTELVSSALGGLFPTIFTCPIELVMIQQQRFGGSFFLTLGSVWSQYGSLSAGLSRGLIPTVGRDVICVVGMLGITPLVQDYFMRRHGQSSASAGLEASLVGGLFSAVPSHPFDVIKTCMQGDLQQTVYKSFLQSFKLLIREGGWPRLFRGCFWRTFNIIGTVYIANECRVRLPSALFGI